MTILRGPQWLPLTPTGDSHPRGFSSEFGSQLSMVEVEVMLNETAGYALVEGREIRKAVWAAIVEAALEANHPLAQEVLEVLECDEWRRQDDKTPPTLARGGGQPRETARC